MYRPILMRNMISYYGVRLNRIQDNRLGSCRSFLLCSIFLGDDWSREETDRLFELCRQFDRRFFVVADRFDGEKTIEDLKSRYYHVVATLMRARAKPSEIQDLQMILKSYDFDVKREKERRRRLEVLYGRTPEQIKEEEQLFYEYRKLEASAKRMLKDRQQLMRLLGNVDLSLGKSPAAAAGASIGATGLGAYLGNVGAAPVRKRRTKKSKAEPAVEATPPSISSTTPSSIPATEAPVMATTATTPSDLPSPIPKAEKSPIEDSLEGMSRRFRCTSIVNSR
jgi:DNA methyltransferase 1-associated protein 1